MVWRTPTGWQTIDGGPPLAALADVRAEIGDSGTSALAKWRKDEREWYGVEATINAWECRAQQAEEVAWDGFFLDERMDAYWPPEGQKAARKANRERLEAMEPSRIGW